MLHIIGMILKIIGIILAVILGILVLLLCIVLFVPLRYQGNAAYDGTPESLRAHAGMSWLFHLVSATVDYKDGKLIWRARAAWKKFGGGETKAGKPPEGRAEERPAESLGTPAAVPPPVTHAEEPQQSAGEPKLSAGKPQLSAREAEREDIPGDQGKKKKKRVRIGDILRRLSQKLRAFFKNIKYTFRKICDKIKMLMEKKEQLTGFLEDEGHRRAFSRLKKEGFRLLGFLRPKRFLLSTRFGFDDPYRTGQVLAALGVIYPFVGGQMSVEPDFENKVLEARLQAKGKVRVIYAAIVAWNLFWDKNVRTLYADVKRMSGKE